MTQTHPKYSFRKRDYVKIRQWYDFSKSNFLPQEPVIIEQKNNQKIKQWHFTFIFKNLSLSEQYTNRQMKSLFKIKQLIFLSSLYHRQRECILNSGKQITMDCEFDVTSLTITCKQDLLYYFYLQQSSLKYYQFYLEIQMISNDGQLLRLGTSRYALMSDQGISRENIFYVYNSMSLQRNKQLNDIKSTERNQKSKKQNNQLSDISVAKIEFEADTQEIKQMKKYLPPFKIINKGSKLAPVNFNLKKKKEKIIPDLSYQINLQEIFIKIEDPHHLKKQLLNNNPFTLSHKDLIQFQILEYNAIIDHHNGWKFLHHKKNQFKQQLIIEKQSEIYISTKKLNNLQINYYQCEGIVLLVLLICQVEFRLKGVVGEKRICSFLIGWLPLPLDLSLKQHRIQLLMINDQLFPSSIYQLFNIQSVLTTSFNHPNYQKYKSKMDEKKMFSDNILIDTTIRNATPYIKLKSRKNNTDSSENLQSEQREELQTYIKAAKQYASKLHNQLLNSRYVPVLGRPQKISKISIHHSTLPMEQTVGKILKIKLDIDTLIPETDSPSDYFIPRCTKGTVYFMRQTHSFVTNICQKQAKYQIPIQLSAKKTTVIFKHLISTSQEFQAIMNSKLIITLYDQEAEKLFAKGEAFAFDILGAVESEKVAYVRLLRWTEFGNKILGKLLLIVDLHTQKPRETNVTVQQFQIQKELAKLSIQQRMRMRIGNFKGDQSMRTQTVNLLKKKKHKQYISNVVMNQQKYDGQMQYQIGVNSYLFINFTNEDTSENNSFTFHLNCIFAEIVTNEQQFRSVQQKRSVQQYNFKKLQYVVKQPAYMSYYQQKLRYNQQIGILIKLNVDEFSQREQVLSKLQLVIKRNTLENKRFLIRCKYKEPLFWSTIFDYCLLGSEEGSISQNTVQISQQILQNYSQLQILSKHVRLNSKNNTMTVSRPTKNMGILMRGKPIDQKQKKSLLYLVTFLHGQQLSIPVGRRQSVSLQLHNKQIAQILHCWQPQIRILNSVRFSLQNLNNDSDLELRMLKPWNCLNFVVGCFDLTGRLIDQYLLRVNCRLDFISNKLLMIFDESSIYSISCENPYPCSCQFSIRCSNRVVVIDEQKIRLQGYGQRLIQFNMKEGWSEENIYFYLIDQMENICQVTEIVWQKPDVQLEQQQRRLSN